MVGLAEVIFVVPAKSGFEQLSGPPATSAIASTTRRVGAQPLASSSAHNVVEERRVTSCTVTQSRQ
jgi:hypothetical protein